LSRWGFGQHPYSDLEPERSLNFLCPDKTLTDRTYLCGEFSVADIANYVFLHAAANMGTSPGDPASPYVTLRSWYEQTGGKARDRVDAEFRSADDESLADRFRRQLIEQPLRSSLKLL
jgi:glutathione S-transferase